MSLRVWLVLGGALTSLASLAHLIVRLPAVQDPAHWIDRVDVLAKDGILCALGIVVFFLGRRVRRGVTEQVRYLLRHRPTAAALGSGLFLVALVLLIVELGFGFLESRKSRPQEVHEGTYTLDFFVDDPVLGYGPARDVAVTSVKRVDDATVYDVVYTVDEEGRRVTPAPGKPDGPLVLFFGGSNTFGEGVADSETLPSRFAALVPSATVYNYGFCGYGPQNMLAMIQDGRLDDVVRGRDVVAIYLFIDAHVARAVGSLVVTTRWGIDLPFYALTPSGGLERHGSFRTGRSWRNWFYALASRYRTFTGLGRDLPPLRSSHFALTARIIEESRRELDARAASVRFCLALHPHVRTRDDLLRHFQGSPVEVLSYVGLYSRDDPETVIEGDWHPTPLAYRMIAAALARDVGFLERTPRFSTGSTVLPAGSAPGPSPGSGSR